MNEKLIKLKNTLLDCEITLRAYTFDMPGWDKKVSAITDALEDLQEEMTKAEIITPSERRAII